MLSCASLHAQPRLDDDDWIQVTQPCLHDTRDNQRLYSTDTANYQTDRQEEPKKDQTQTTTHTWCLQWFWSLCENDSTENVRSTVQGYE